ncbi:hypothetical protein C4D60_Mb08t21410 [Musa balbisiana]|uniref:Uncharacterized protein n=1 Tax=Musa balbisiana TaxID=52838 RepID=A0A4S8K5E1_MUSBA|nr:hypothetical protein C4D60_Mb08t21410 [Musa balbisiana]
MAWFATYARGALIPDIARQLYGSPSEVLIEKVVKSLLWDACRIISSLGDKNAELRCQIEELKAGTTAEQQVANLEWEVARLKLELEGVGQQ